MKLINLPVVLRVQGWLLLIEATFMLAPIAVSCYYHEWPTAICFTYATLLTIIAGLMMARWLRPSPGTSMRRREGVLLTAIIWVFFSFFGMLPLLFTGTVDNVTDAFFETMSGFTTTGSSIIADVESLPRGVLFWRSMMQWIGGMGIILFTLAVLPMLNQKGGIALFNAEVTGITHERLRPRVSQTAKDLWLIYIILTITMTALLVKPMGWYDAVSHAMTTMATGGFSTKNAGLHFWNSYYVYGVAIVFMFLGGINFSLIYNASRGRFDRVRSNDTFRFYCFFTLLVAVVIFINMCVEGYASSDGDRAVFALFDTVAAITSTGLSTIDYETRGEFIAMILLVVIFFGGMAGSTSGGAKIDRFIVLLKNTLNEFYRVLHPNAVKTVRINGRALAHTLVAKVIAFLAIYVMVTIIAALVLFFRSFMSFRICAWIVTSRAVVGSSAMRILGLHARAIAIMTL